MKPNTAKFWKLLAVAYLVFLFGVIFVLNPDFTNYVNWFLFIPLYVFLIISICLRHKNDQSEKAARAAKIEGELSLFVSTAIVFLFILLAEYIRK